MFRCTKNSPWYPWGRRRSSTLTRKRSALARLLGVGRPALLDRVTLEEVVG